MSEFLFLGELSQSVDLNLGIYTVYWPF